MDDQENVAWCPSAKPDRPEAVVLGIHADSDGLTYLDTPVPAAEAVALLPPDVIPTRVLRFAGHCYASCHQRIGDSCGLVTKTALHAPAVEDSSLPRCHLRPRCKWWQQTGADACRRCPLVVHDVRVDDELSMRIANPNVAADQV
ncbi:hypothetical protein P3T37_002310 [Kitasatospora sp. MAA4]|uniref:hypothetical protein n=1 Tax=Kitasatospora sp. MAA4 TaxID=3035093 RepID=UPI00247562EC|nr:hypothetical protein [Kitasatospora sp. MAA4]MDH6132924.1 hypothetical protein [Kitasatospora sp. MAA4]